MLQPACGITSILHLSSQKERTREANPYCLGFRVADKKYQDTVNKSQMDSSTQTQGVLPLRAICSLGSQQGLLFLSLVFDLLHVPFLDAHILSSKMVEIRIHCLQVLIRVQRNNARPDLQTTKDYINTNFYSYVCLSTNKKYRLYLCSVVSLSFFFFQIHGILYQKIQISQAQPERGNNHVATIFISS